VQTKKFSKKNHNFDRSDKGDKFALTESDSNIIMKEEMEILHRARADVIKEKPYS
jgi:hypothetical protein